MYYLVAKLDLNNPAKVRKEPFDTEELALRKACALLASGTAFECVIEDEDGIVADDAEVAERCASL